MGHKPWNARQPLEAGKGKQKNSPSKGMQP